MCKSKSAGGIRCSNQERERVRNLSAKLDEAKAYGDPEKIVALEGRLTAAQRDYDLTACGRQELADQAANPMLSPKERSLAKRKLAEANASLEKQRLAREKAFQKQAALRQVLTDAGVDKAQIEAVVALGVSEDQSRWLRPARYYRDLSAKLLKEKKSILSAFDREEAGIWVASKEEGWSKQETARAIEAFEVKKSERLAPLNRKIQDARFSYNCTVEGQEKLRNKLSALPASEYKQKARIRWSLQSAERYHRARLTHRERRTLFNRRVKEVMAAAGSDPKLALDAYRQPDPASLGSSRKDPHEICSGNRVHVSDLDRNEILKAFRASPEYKERGDKGLNAYLTNRLRQDPRSLHTGTVEDANAGVEIFSTPNPGRNSTMKTGNRERSFNVSLTEKERGELAETASTLNMEFSSYARAMFLGKDPFAYQNDRSPAHRAFKAQNMKKLLGDD